MNLNKFKYGVLIYILKLNMYLILKVEFMFNIYILWFILVYYVISLFYELKRSKYYDLLFFF